MFVSIVLLPLITEIEYQSPCLSRDYDTTHTIPFPSHHVPSCVFYPHLCLSTPHRPLLYVQTDCYQWISQNKQNDKPFPVFIPG
ncbi:hypothetical protein Y032_0208g2079 [Ancylostoma ceylanicum]|uniref:Secreted protein n=1 Tax=Ancylostoma ceylanicum TaxID=53326 RepID=A0A016SKM8_9BILA|nr:hypothetical protein Y032_0208g2079 [Ancylostoma ceylanicum]